MCPQPFPARSLPQLPYCDRYISTSLFCLPLSARTVLSTTLSTDLGVCLRQHYLLVRVAQVPGQGCCWQRGYIHHYQWRHLSFQRVTCNYGHLQGRTWRLVFFTCLRVVLYRVCTATTGTGANYDTTCTCDAYRRNPSYYSRIQEIQLISWLVLPRLFYRVFQPYTGYDISYAHELHCLRLLVHVFPSSPSLSLPTLATVALLGRTYPCYG